MSATWITILSYAIPATLLAGLTMWVGHERRVRWYLSDYLFVYIPFVLVFIHIAIMFGDIDTAVIRMGFGTAATVTIAMAGGFFGGLTLLPRLFYPENEIKPMVLSSATSTVVGLLCLKMFFLAAVIANPKALVAAG